MGIAEPVRRLTEAEYLALEQAAEFKSEFFRGEMLVGVTFGPAPIREQILRPA